MSEPFAAGQSAHFSGPTCLRGLRRRLCAMRCDPGDVVALSGRARARERRPSCARPCGRATATIAAAALPSPFGIAIRGRRRSTISTSIGSTTPPSCRSWASKTPSRRFDRLRRVVDACCRPRTGPPLRGDDRGRRSAAAHGNGRAPVTTLGLDGALGGFSAALVRDGRTLGTRSLAGNVALEARPRVDRRPLARSRV